MLVETNRLLDLKAKARQPMEPSEFAWCNFNSWPGLVLAPQREPKSNEWPNDCAASAKSRNGARARDTDRTVLKRPYRSSRMH